MRKNRKNSCYDLWVLTVLICVFFSCGKVVKNEQLSGSTSIEHKDDSFRLVYTVSACDCPDWVDYKKSEQYKADLNPNKKQFDTTFEDSYYIERNGTNTYPELKMGMVVDFFGKLDTNKRLSKEAIYMDPNPIKGKIIMYSNYKIIKQGITFND